MDCSQWGYSVHGILQARILEWGCHPSPSDLPDCIAGGFFTTEPSGKPLSLLDKYKHWVNVCRDWDESWFFFNWPRVKILGLKETRDCQRAISPPSEIFHSPPTQMTDSLHDPRAYPKHTLLLPSVIIPHLPFDKTRKKGSSFMHKFYLCFVAKTFISGKYLLAFEGVLTLKHIIIVTS